MFSIPDQTMRHLCCKTQPPSLSTHHSLLCNEKAWTRSIRKDFTWIHIWCLLRFGLKFILCFKFIFVICNVVEWCHGASQLRARVERCGGSSPPSPPPQSCSSPTASLSTRYFPLCTFRNPFQMCPLWIYPVFDQSSPKKVDNFGGEIWPPQQPGDSSGPTDTNRMCYLLTCWPIISPGSLRI